MVSVIALLFMLLVPVPTQAATYFVATTGSNANNGTSEATPFLTVAYCVSTMLAGDTCLVRGGTYNSGVIRFSRTGTQDSPITLSNYPGELPIIVFQSYANLDRILIQNSSGQNVAMGWIIIQGLELTGGHDGIKFHSLHDSIIRNNHIHDVGAMGIMGIGGTRNLFERNIIHHNGRFAACDAGTSTECFHDHGIYAHGTHYTIRNNIFYWHQGYGVQQNGSSTSLFNSSIHPSAEFAEATNWIITDNTFAYSRTRGGLVHWGSRTSNARVENNIFYENSVEVNSEAQAVTFCCSANIGATNIVHKNNHSYGSGSGGTAYATGGLYTASGNVTNVSPPAFVNGGNNSLPASPDFRLTASAPVNIAIANEFPNNGIVGAFKTVGTPTASMTANKITLPFPMSTAVPIQNLSTAGVSISCPSTVCPGSPVVSSVSRIPGTDSQVEITISGITGNACLSHADAVTVSYNSAIGSWTGNDNIGPYPGLHQKILSFTGLSVTNQCTGSGPPAGGAAHAIYAMEDGTGTIVSDTSGNALHGTTSGTWVSGKTGFGIHVEGGTTQQTTIPYGSGIDPTVTSMTWVVPVYIPTGQTSVTRYLFGPEIGANQRGYIGASSGTWRVARQSTSISAAGASNLAVVDGWNYLVARWDGATDTVTLCNNGVTGTGGAAGPYTSYTFATNFEFPLVGSNLHATVPEATFDDVQVFTSLQDCASLYAAWNAPPPPAVGTLKQAAIRFNGVVLDTSGNPIPLGSLVHSISVPKRGGGVILFELKCNAGTDCAQTAFKLVYVKNGSTTWQQVPNTETADGVWMWGPSTAENLNNGPRATSLTGSCTMQTGSTLMTAEQVPSLALAQNTCTVLAYVVHVDGVAGVDYFDFKLRTQDNLDLAGGYDEIARIMVVNPMATGIGF